MSDEQSNTKMSEVHKAAFIANVVNQKLEGKKVNYAQAARDAGYSEKHAKDMARYLLRKDEVQEAIKVRLAAAGISDAEIIGTAASILRYNIGDCIDISEDGQSFTYNLNKAKTSGAIVAIKKLTCDAKGRVTDIQMHDVLKAQDHLASIRGLKRAEVKPDDLALRRMIIEDDIRAFREKQLIASGGDEQAADEAAAQYRKWLSEKPEYRPYMDVDDDRTADADPAS